MIDLKHATTYLQKVALAKDYMKSRNISFGNGYGDELAVEQRFERTAEHLMFVVILSYGPNR